MDLKNVSKTLFVPLKARAKSSRDRKINFLDTYAEELIAKYSDFSKTVLVDPATQYVCTKRAKIIDQLTDNFLSAYEKSILIQLGSGLCTRPMRIKNKCEQTFEVDFSSVNELKKTFFKNVLQENHKLIDGDLSKQEWKNEIPQSDLPTVIVLEGVSMYLQKEDMRSILDFVEMRNGPCLFIFDYFPKFLAKHTLLALPIYLLGARFSFGLNNPEELLQKSHQLKLNSNDSLTLGKSLITYPFKKLYAVASFKK